jgi:hypothetical protein
MMSDPSRVRVSGPLEPYAAGFRDELKRLGYRRNAAGNQLQLMAHVSRWLEHRRFDPIELTPARVDEFLVDRRAEGYRLWLSTKATKPMLDFLRGVGVVRYPSLSLPDTAADELIEIFRSYLIRERGLAEATVTSYVHVARLFLSDRSAIGAADLGSLTGREVTGFVLAETANRSVGSAQYVACGLRAFLRFAYVTGRNRREVGCCRPEDRVVAAVEGSPVDQSR